MEGRRARCSRDLIVEYFMTTLPEIPTFKIIRKWGICVVQSLSWVQLCNPMDCGPPGSSVLHYLPEFAQIQVHDVIYRTWQTSCGSCSKATVDTEVRSPTFSLSNSKGALLPRQWIPPGFLRGCLGLKFQNLWEGGSSLRLTRINRAQS